MIDCIFRCRQRLREWRTRTGTKLFCWCCCFCAWLAVMWLRQTRTSADRVIMEMMVMFQVSHFTEC